MIIYSSWSSHHSTNVYGPDAWSFRPERWEDGSLPADPPGYVPFNSGPRVCPGREFSSLFVPPFFSSLLTYFAEDYAFIEVSYITTRILQRFETLACCDCDADDPANPGAGAPAPWEENLAGLTLSNERGVKVRFE